MNATVNDMATADEAERKRATRRTTLWLAVLAAAFYFGFIAISIVRGLQ
jgi:hypothetical protein